MTITQSAPAAATARLQNSTTCLLVGNIEPTMAWYERLGFKAHYYPPGFAALVRDSVKIFLQQQPGYVRPDDPGAREREAWSAYIECDNVAALCEEFSRLPDVTIARPLCRQEYGAIEFDVLDPNGYRLVFAQPVR